MYYYCGAAGQLFVRSCIPGALDREYNPSQTPVNLCEGCASGGYRKCQRNSEEQYYGASGAFRCLVESKLIGWSSVVTYDAAPNLRVGILAVKVLADYFFAFRVRFIDKLQKEV